MTRPCVSRLRLLIIPLISALLFGCGSGVEQPSGGSPESIAALEYDDVAYDLRPETALKALEVAESKAMMWNRKANLVSVPMTRLMEANFGLPGHIPGWFFMFMVPDSPLEYYVKVNDGKFSGATEAQPILVEDLPYTILPLDLSNIKLNSDDAVNAWLARGGNGYLTNHPGAQLDFRLVHLESQEHATWSIFDFSGGEAPLHLFSVDAATGQEVSDPFLLFR